MMTGVMMMTMLLLLLLLLLVVMMMVVVMMMLMLVMVMTMMMTLQAADHAGGRGARSEQELHLRGVRDRDADSVPKVTQAKSPSLARVYKRSNAFL
jgi:flagellar basal body-associated protein FliL